jgi:Domain of unknown function (DUF4274)
MPAHEEYDEDDDIDHSQVMIDWLADKDPDVWFEVSHHLNWDNSERVLDWIVSQPRCDKANAAFIFWGANPLWHLPRVGTSEHWDSDGFKLIEKILKNWKAGRYARAELAWTEDNRAKHQQALAGIWGKRDPLAIPPALLAPWKGRKPKVPKELLAENNKVLNRLFLNLGTSITTRDEARQRRKARLAEQRAEILGHAFETLDFYRRAAPWLALFAVVMIGGAFALRWINKGVLF